MKTVFKNILAAACAFIVYADSAHAGPSRIRSTKRTRNIYGVNAPGGNIGSNPRIFGDYDGLAQNYFGKIAGIAGRSNQAPSADETSFARMCTTDDSNGPELRYRGTLGYEKGFSACEAAEYEEFRKRRRRYSN